MDYKEKTRTSYQETATEYTQKVADLAPILAIQQFFSFLPSRGKILDIGCGSGRDAKIFCDQGFAVTGIDFCSNLLEIAQETAPLATFHLMDMESLDFPEESFDGVWSASALPHIPKTAIFLVFEKIYTVLKRGGTFCFTLKKGQGELLERDERYEGNHEKFWAYYTEQEIQDLLAKTHFTQIDLALIPKKHAYQSHDAYRIYCKKSF